MLKSFDESDQKTEGKRLDAMVDRLRGSSDPQCALLMEHFLTAGSYIQGEMPEEFALNLSLAREVLFSVKDAALRRELSDGISALLNDLHAG